MKKNLLLLLALLSYTACIAQLRVVSPNGGEFYPAGGSMEIMWDGVEADDEITIEFSSNGGKSWEIVAEGVSGLKYLWEELPKFPSDKCLIRIRQLNTGPAEYKLQHTLKHKVVKGRRYLGMKWSPDGNKIISVNDYDSLGQIWVWNTNTGERISVINIPENELYFYEWSPDGKFLATMTDERFCRIWDTETGNQIKEIILPDFFDCSYMKWSPDGSRLALPYKKDNGNIIIYNTQTWEQEYKIELLHGSVYHEYFRWMNQSQNLVLYGYDSVFVIDAAKKEMKSIFKHFYGGWYTYWSDYRNFYGYCWISFHNFWDYLSPDDSKIFLPKGDTVFHVYELNTGKLLFPIVYTNYFEYGNSYQNFLINWSPDSKKIAIRDTNKYGTVNIIDSENGKVLKKINSIYNFYPEWNRDSYRIASLWLDKVSLKIIDTDYGKTLHMIKSPDTINIYRWSPDGERIAAACYDSTVRIWHISNPVKQEDISDASWSLVVPRATAVDIDMGIEITGCRKDSVIAAFVTNSGIVSNKVKQIYFEGADRDMFTANEDDNLPVMAPGESIPVDFHFSPASPGIKTADIVIITYADTLRQKIRGEGILPDIELLSNIVDFGEVMVNKSKDSLVLLVHNKSPRRAQIDSIILTGNNPDRFKIIENVPFFIGSGEKKEVLIRFSPNAIGKFSAEAECYYASPLAPAVLQLLGTGVFRPAEIFAADVDFGALVCKQQSESQLEVRNNGMEDLIISEATISGANKPDFEFYPPFTQITIPPDQSRFIYIIFKPADSGNKNAELILKSNSHINPLLIIKLDGLKDSIDLRPVNSVVDLGFLCPGETKDTTTAIFNNGTLGSGAYAVPTSGLSLNVSEFVVEKSGSFVLPFRFNGKIEEGKFSENIAITDSICGYVRNVEVRGEVSIPRIEVGGNKFFTKKGLYEEKALRIKNTGPVRLIITSPPVLNPPLELAVNNFPITVPAGESRDIIIGFNPADTLETIQDITLLIEPCFVTESITLTGKGYVAKAKLRAGIAEAFAGESVEIPIYLEETQNISLAGANSLNTDIIYNSTILSPQGIPFQNIDNITGSVSLKNLPLNGIAGEEITRVKFTAALGNSEYSPILFSNIESDAGGIDFDTVSGCFRLLGVCRDGGNRLINSTGGEILSILPNPASEILEIEFDLQESGWTRIYLSDIIGNEVKLIYESNVTTYGKRKLSANINDMAAGVYFVILQTPTGRQAAVIIKN